MDKKRKKIFVADDEEDILTIIAMILRTEHFEVQASVNANDLFDLQHPLPDLILLDIWMSGLDGRDICRKIKEDATTKNIPLIFISANSGIAEITEECKADGFIAKPFEMEFLLSTVRDVLNGK